MGRDPTKLTSKEEKLVRLVASGMAKNEAYKKSYSADKMSENSISVEVNKKLKLPKITLRYQQLIDKHTEKALWSREKAYKSLLKSMEISEEDRNMNTFISAIKELNSLENLYPKEDNKSSIPQKVEFVISGVSKNES